MTSTNPEPSDKNDVDFLEASNEANELSESQPPRSSATTEDEPSFGWSGYAERINGRFAMVGFIAILLIEAITNDSFINWIGLMP
tara:strand:- start:3021 stop:3275 length:255 start_codon:yes stop_codon:yes gene_type:complete